MAVALNFQQKVVTNVETLRAQAAGMQSYGITVGQDHVALIILANLDRSARETWGNDFRTPLQTIRQSFPHNHVHDEHSITIMLKGRWAPRHHSIATVIKGMAGADAVRKLTDALRKMTGTTNAVADGVEYLTILLRDSPTYDTDADLGSAYAASS